MALLRAYYKSQESHPIFPIGGVDVSSQKIQPDFGAWLQNGINTGLSRLNRNDPTLKLWHINGSVEMISKYQKLLTFHETDRLTDFEKTILKLQDEVLVTSNYTRGVFEESNIKAKYIDLGFDSDNFYSIAVQPIPHTITFGLFGKFELRKGHAKILRAWAKAFGNNFQYRLVAAISNPFLGKNPNEAQAALNRELTNIFEGKRYGNISIINPVATNAEYNHIINNIDIVLACSRGEGRDLPVFHAVGLGKHCVGLNAHAYKDYLNQDNAVLIEPSGMIEANDGIFFRPGTPTNQGYFFDFNEDDFIFACKAAVTRYNKCNLNTNGLQLQEKTYTHTISQL